ncbi:MAG: hypothetical protein WKF65_17025 [Gaiellaceae bacterium]
MTNKTSKDGTPKSYRERIDPGDEFGKQVKGLALLGSSPFRRVLQALGVEKETLDDAKALRRTYERLVSEPDRVADALAPLGWAFHEMAPFDDYVAAATLVGQGKTEEAEDLLTESYNGEDGVHLRFFHRVWSLYSGDEQREAIAQNRQRLLQEAYDLHTQGRYAGAIALVLTQIDGIFIDMTGKPAKYFFDPENPNLVDDVTLAGHPLGLKALSELMSKPSSTTVVSDELTRQGILHGRVLAYDTRRNSTKTFTALLAVIEGVRPRADELTKKAAEKRERLYTGSKEVDEWGRRLDRRGFDGARSSSATSSSTSTAITSSTAATHAIRLSLSAEAAASRADASRFSRATTGRSVARGRRRQPAWSLGSRSAAASTRTGSTSATRRHAAVSTATSGGSTSRSRTPPTGSGLVAEVLAGRA